MSLIQQFLKSFRETDQMEPGLIQKNDGTVWLVNPDGSETQVGGGGGSVSIATFDCTVLCNGPFPDVFFRTVLPIDPVNQAYGRMQMSPTTALYTFSAGAPFTYESLTVAQVDTSNDDYKITVIVNVQNTDGSETLLLQGQATLNSGGPGDSAIIDPGSLSVLDQSGDDLSYDSDTGDISSAGGGIYSVVLTVKSNWD